MKKYRILLALLGLGLIALGIGLYMFNKKVPTLQKAKADYTLTADELYDAFENDESKASALYENKIIAVSGEVESIKSNGSQQNIILKAENAISGGINCSFNEPVNNINKGESITIKGRCQGFLMDVILNNCYAEIN